MKSGKMIRTRSNLSYHSQQSLQERLDRTISTPLFHQDGSHSHRPGRKRTVKTQEISNDDVIAITPRNGHSTSEFQLKLPKKSDRLKEKIIPIHTIVSGKGDDKGRLNYIERRSMDVQRSRKINMSLDYNLIGTESCCNCVQEQDGRDVSNAKAETCHDALLKRIRDVQNDTRKSARIIKDSKLRLQEIQKKSALSETDVRELGERNELLLREMQRFDKLTKIIQGLVTTDVTPQCRVYKEMKNVKHEKNNDNSSTNMRKEFTDQTSVSQSKQDRPHMHNKQDDLVGLQDLPEFKGWPDIQEWPTLQSRSTLLNDNHGRSKSEVDLTRKLCESYDMQEKLVADNADLEVKRYIMYKELMLKDQSLETSQAQIKRLQGELKLMSKENTVLLEKLNKYQPEGDATAISKIQSCLHTKIEHNNTSPAEQLKVLEKYKESSTVDVEQDLGELEVEVRNLRTEMDALKAPKDTACRGGGGQNTCFTQPAGSPPVPPVTKACGVCPPCPAPCNPDAPPTPAEREVMRLGFVLKTTEENFKTKVTECAMLRTDLVRKKEELEKERCQHRETQNKLRELEMKFEGLTAHTNMLLGTKEQALETEVSVRALKQCYREAREEIDELRTLTKEQNEQIQDYRSKYMQAQQLVEEQKRQMDIMDMDNTRISEQINLEIQRVKIKFQEKLQELSPIPDLLKATQMRLKDAQQSQAIAEHNAEQLARELSCAREKVHVLLHNSLKQPEQPPKTNDDKQMSILQQKITQLSEANVALKTEVDRLKANVIRMEESVLHNEKRLQEKMHECAVLGGELDRARDEAARALTRANERTETIRKCLQTTVAELERQLAACRAQVKSAEKEREEVQCRMNCQIQRLNENFEQAQLRIIGLTTQVQTLRKTVSSTFDGDGEGDQGECACKAFFENP